MRIAHVSDLHLACRPLWSELTVKRLTGYLNYRFNRGFRHREEKAAAAVAGLANDPPDMVVVTGDLVQTGLDAEFLAVERLFAPLTGKGIPVVVVDGNHDHYGAASRESWNGLRGRLALHAEADEFGIRRFPSLDILALDQGAASPPFLSYGRVDIAGLDRAREGWSAPGGRTLRVVCGHYPLIGAGGAVPGCLRGLRGRAKLLEFLREVRAAAYLCGHHHQRFAADLGGGVAQYAAPSLSRDGKTDIFECLNGAFRLAETR